jgi:hypothetical protein
MPALASPSVSKSVWVLTGNRDTLYTVGVLDLGKGPEILHVPDMASRYYSIEFVDPWLDIFADVGHRTPVTRSGDYLISGPRWNGVVPEGVTMIASTSNSVLLIGRVLVEGDRARPLWLFERSFPSRRALENLIAAEIPLIAMTTMG